jgi:hypothetical protein
MDQPSSTISALAGTCRSLPTRLHQLGALPRSRPAKAYSERLSGTGVTAPRMVAGSAPSATATGKGLPRMARPAASRENRARHRGGEPAHDELVADRSPAGGRCRDSAAACCGPRVMVSPQVISGAASPGQQVCTGSRPRSTSLALEHLSGRARAGHLRRHVQHLLQQRPLLPGIFQALGRFRLLEIGQQLADLAQLADLLLRPCRAPPAAACRTGCSAPAWWLGFSNSSAGPPRNRVRSQISVISSRTPGLDTPELAALFQALINRASRYCMRPAVRAGRMQKSQKRGRQKWRG